MALGKALGVAALVAVAVGMSVLVTTPVAGGHSESQSARCGKWAVRAHVRAKSVCLREGARCERSLQQGYTRYGFVCESERLAVTWTYLRKRPLDRVEVALAPGSACPVTTQIGHVGSLPGLGPGPAFPVGTDPIIKIPIPPRPEWGPEWSGSKRLWLLDPTYRGRVLVRGRRLDEPGEVRFVYGRPAFTKENQRNPVRELRLEGYSDFPAQTRVQSAGCYAYQVEGRTFSYPVVFEAQVPRNG
jgi:hypothetical protein